jgi:hypothetical protein
MWRNGIKVCALALASIPFAADAAVVKFTIGSGPNENSSTNGAIFAQTTSISDAQACPLSEVGIGAGISASIAANALGDAYDSGACAGVDVTVLANTVTVDDVANYSLSFAPSYLYSEGNVMKIGGGGGGIPPGPSDLTVPFFKPGPGGLALILKDANGDDTDIGASGDILFNIEIDGATALVELMFSDDQSTRELNEELNGLLSGFISTGGVEYVGLVEGYPTFLGNFDYDVNISFAVSCTAVNGSNGCGPDNDPGFVVGVIATSVIPEPATLTLLGVGLLATAWIGRRRST